MTDPLRLLIVCLGNICRSPMAEGALRTRLADAGLEHQVLVDSAGLGRWHAGEPADPRAIACAAGHRVDISSLRARQLKDRDFREFDWLLCADRSVLDAVRQRMPAQAKAKAIMLLGYVGDPEAEIPDPYTGGPADFEHVWGLVDSAAGVIVRMSGAAADD